MVVSYVEPARCYQFIMKNVNDLYHGISDGDCPGRSSSPSNESEASSLSILSSSASSDSSKSSITSSVHSKRSHVFDAVRKNVVRWLCSASIAASIQTPKRITLPRAPVPSPRVIIRKSRPVQRSLPVVPLPQSTRLYVGNIRGGVETRALKQFFEPRCGPITSIQLRCLGGDAMPVPGQVNHGEYFATIHFKHPYSIPTALRLSLRDIQCVHPGLALAVNLADLPIMRRMLGLPPLPPVQDTDDELMIVDTPATYYGQRLLAC
ncbi:hypothetical protein CYLTODRAFT_485228 [Cylindrobasidium torrendii FP15055 ss-10]|uniref:RRM domain-containing protein n=1 Tax=Cylindrobasidium torrendii FP15055 ss-10 TaxID=1314674 RepID=A0A0D7BVT8_9AGAR|nr:hypothetical protein CYLTODRAFT_485228 [Cylindrobasidium torrendii FP15055 ss-10]